MEPRQVTVAVPVKDRREQMLRCLDALLAQDHPSYDVLVLDNESSDGTAEACRERARDARVPVRVVTVPGTVGAVRNHAARLTGADYLAFTDSDCLPEPAWLSAATAALDADPGLGVVQGRTLPETEPEHGWPATLRVEEFSGLYEGCNLVFRREPFAASAGFEEEVGHFWEDTPAGFALTSAGWRAAFVPGAVVRHDVTYPGFWWHVRRMQKHRNLAAAIRREPAIRREVLFLRAFLAPRDLRFRGLLAGVLLAGLDRRALLLALPYLLGILRADGRLVVHPKSHLHALLYDASRTLGVWRGAVAHRVFLP